MSDPNVVISPDMGLPIPLLNDQGPNYASNVSAALTIIDSHNHETGSGVGIDLSQMYTTGDISADGYNFSNARSIQFLSQPSTLTGSQDVNSVYVNQNNLGFNNSNGVFVPITSGNSLAITTLLLTNFYPYAISANYTILPTDQFNLIDANSSGGPITITLPIASFITPSPIGRFYIIRDVGESAATYNIQVKVAGGSGNTFADDGSTTFTINQNGGYVLLYTDGASQWYTWGQNIYQGQGITMNAASYIDLNESVQSFVSSTITMDTGSTFSSTGSIDLNGVTILNSLNITTDTNSQFVYNNAAFTENGTDHTFQSGSIVTLASSSDAYFQGPIILGNLTGYPYPSIPSTPTLYVNNGVISLLTSNALVANYPGAAASGVSGGITSHIAGGITSGADGGISLSGSTSDWITYASPRSQYINIPIIPNYLPSGNNSSPTYVVNPYTGKDGWSYSTLTSSTVQVLQSGRTADQSGSPPPAFPPVWIPLGQLTDGATFASLTLTLQLFSNASRTPTQGLNLSIYASTAGSTTLIAGQSLGSYTSSAVQTLTAIVGPLVVINNQTTTYNAVITDEYDAIPSHSVGGNYFIQLTALMTNITSNQL